MKRPLAIIALLCTLAFAQELEIHYIDVGQGDAVFIRAPTGQGILYDGGRGRRTTLEYLQAINVQNVSLVIASHQDADHIGGLEAVLRAFQPRFYLDNNLTHTTQTYASLMESLIEIDATLLTRENDALSVGDDLTLTFWHPASTRQFDNNNNSVGMLVTFGAFTASLTGDAEAEQFNWWAETHPEYLLDVDVHRSSHHGSENGDTPLSISRLKPEIVVISAGKDNSYGHPSERALRLYSTIGAEIIRTDLEGSIVLRAKLDGSFSIQTSEGFRTFDQAASLTSTTVKLQTEASKPTSAAPNLIIRCVLYNPDGEDAGHESVTLEAIEAAFYQGLRLSDEAGNERFLGDINFAAGDVFTLRFERSTWNNDGDTARLFDGFGTLLDSLSYAGGGVEACR